MIDVSVFDAKPYDREYLEKAARDSEIGWRFHEYRLSAETAATARGARVICVFVNDAVDRSCLEILAKNDVGLVALRCAGYNNVDLTAAKALGIPVIRVPAYSPHAVAEHAVALLLTLNRKIHRAYNRVREHNFSLQGLVGFDLHGKTVGIIGTGRIGRIAAQIFRGFETTVLACDPYPVSEWAERFQVRYTTLPELLAASDVVSLHSPLLPAT
ncbi:MAG: NAD(P)-dependent oxidoreductase, partial [Verrucomicrobiota bacterium]